MNLDSKKKVVVPDFLNVAHVTSFLWTKRK